ncbi:MAG: hypothetical protein U0V02_17365 [Anaerolineales bacterium]
MKLIDRYVTEVSKRLPLVKGRKDIENELRSTLEDMLEDRAQKEGKPADEAMEIELLKEYGAPQKVAETYNPTPYLIGPRMFPMFIMLLKIVVAAVTLAMTIVTVIQLVSLSPVTGMEVLKVIGEGILNIISASLGAFGNIALVFALIERFAPAAEFKVGEDEKWDPTSLMKEPEPNDVKLWEPILAIVFLFIVISIFNFNRQFLSLNYSENNIWIIGFGGFIANKQGTIPIFSAAFFRWLPLMNAAWVAEIILNGMLIRSGRWDISTRLLSIGIKVLQIVINALLLTGPFILGFTAEALMVSKVFDADSAQTLITVMHQGVPILLGLGIFGSVVDIIKTGYKAITQRQTTSA